MIKSCTAIFGERLRKLRIESGLSQQALSTELEISKAALCYYENGQRAPDINILACVADYFNVSADYLLGRSDVKRIDPSQKINAACEITGLSLESIGNLIEVKKRSENPNLIIENSGFIEIVHYIETALATYKNKEYNTKIISPLIHDSDFYNRLILNDECIHKAECEDKNRIGGCALCFKRYLDKDYVYSLICNNLPGNSLKEAPSIPWGVTEYYITSEEEFQEKVEVSEYRATKSLSDIFSSLISAIDLETTFREYNNSLRNGLVEAITQYKDRISSKKEDELSSNDYSIQEYEAIIKALQTYLDKYDENFKLKEQKGAPNNGSNNSKKE